MPTFVADACKAGPGRGLAQAAAIIGPEYPGVLIRDGCQSYRQSTAARHQSCPAAPAPHLPPVLLDYPTQPFVVGVKAVLQLPLRPDARGHNWRAEHALRPAVLTRKMCDGGNRSADQRGLDASALLVQVLTAPTPTVPHLLRTTHAEH